VARGDHGTVAERRESSATRAGAKALKNQMPRESLIPATSDENHHHRCTRVENRRSKV